MSNVFPFIAKLTAEGDWTSGERAWLLELAGKVSNASDGMEVVFGQSDEGEPWCVVLDPAGEVLVHVARVAGQFVLHHLPDDGIQQGADLATALRRFMGADWNDGRDDVVVQLNAHGRQAQTVLALIVATAFYYATADATVVGSGAGEISSAPIEPPVAAATLADDLTLDTHRDAPAETHQAPEMKAEIPSPPAALRHVDTEIAVAAPSSTPHQFDVPLAEPTPAPDRLQIAEAPRAAPLWLPASFERLAGGDGNDLLIGGPGPSLLIGGAGNDTLDGGGAPPGKVDVLDGGPGNDRILLSANAVAIGGPGADIFVVGAALPAPPVEAATAATSPASGATATATPTPMATSAATALGVILDFHQSEGDQLVSANGGAVVVVTTTPEADVLALVHQEPGLQNFAATPGERVEVDIDGDGKVDGYLLIAPVNAVTVAPAHDPAPEAAGGAPMVGVSPAASAEMF